MSAPGITYTGVLARKNANSSRSAGVFQGLNFWVSVNLANRTTCMDMIKENGGTVVLKEDKADLLICDPAKAPARGSYSYRLIADAVKEGSLDSKEDYLCQQVISKPKLTRTRFTKEDDEILTRFVMEKEREGERISGNDIYKEFAGNHPHHTWQSWRDRWAKKLKSIPRPDSSHEEAPPQPKDTPVASRRRAVVDDSPVSKTRTRFTAEEDDILLKTIHDAISNFQPWNGYPPYKRLAGEWPQRTWESWRERALNHVAKRNKDQISQWEFEAGFHADDVAGPPAAKNRDQETRTVQDKANPKSPLIDQRDKTATLQTADRLHEEDDGHHSVDEDHNHQELRDTVLNYSIPPPMPDASVTTEEQFYRDYNTFLESTEITSRPIPSVQGKAIALWDLWQLVRSKKVEISELDWQQVAEDLGFNWRSMKSVPKDIQHCYEEHLAPFAEAMMNFNDSDEDDELIDDNPGADTDGPLPSSPPLLPSLKRSYAAASLGERHISPREWPKRRKTDRIHEMSSPISLHDSDRTPRASPRTQAPRSSNLRAVDEMGDTLSSLPLSPPKRRGQLEPETQDFVFDTNTQLPVYDQNLVQSDDESQNQITPSQQLHRESDAVSSPLRDKTPITPTPHRRTQVPDEIEDSEGEGIQRGRKSSRSASALHSAQQARRTRTLPWISETPDAAGSTVVRGTQPSSATVPETERPTQSARPKDTPEDVIDHFISLGYGKDIVLRSLKATSWIIGNAGQVMEMLKQGEPLPQRTTGVWTQRDDDSLAAVFSEQPARDEKEEKKRAKDMRRLEAKHGAEQIALRKRYLLDEIPSK
ncbi:hypothetical protein F4777DRAFT_114684 [Nemania sp. FL0916]|nr:hypothetical protein F4777DRAFT_114684 [Nemania sp. FL0916]